MSHITKEEYLSAYFDGEAGSFEQHRICDQLISDDEMRTKLSSFALIGEAMKNQTQAQACVAGSSFLSGIQEAIADEAPLVMEDPTVVSLGVVREKRNLPKQAFGYAVAASVVAVAAISFQNYNSTPKNEVQTANAPESINQIVASSVIPKLQTSSAVSKAPAKKSYLMTASLKAPDAHTRGLMNKYVAHHLQYASSSTLMPRVRAVSYSTDF